jgi:hypothetical protein
LGTLTILAAAYRLQARGRGQGGTGRQRAVHGKGSARPDVSSAPVAAPDVAARHRRRRPGRMRENCTTPCCASETRPRRPPGWQQVRQPANSRTALRFALPRAGGLPCAGISGQAAANAQRSTRTRCSAPARGPARRGRGFCRKVSPMTRPRHRYHRFLAPRARSENRALDPRSSACGIMVQLEKWSACTLRSRVRGWDA